MVKEFGKEDFKKRGMSDIKLHHRLLECYLYKNQSLKMAIESERKKSPATRESKVMDVSDNIAGKLEREQVEIQS